MHCVNAPDEGDKTSGSDDCPTPSTPIDTFEYDDDGNLRFDDQYEFTWDSENRLIWIATRIDLGGHFGGYDEAARKGVRNQIS